MDGIEDSYPLPLDKEGGDSNSEMSDDDSEVNYLDSRDQPKANSSGHVPNEIGNSHEMIDQSA